MRLKKRNGFALIILAVILAVTGILLIAMMSPPGTQDLDNAVSTKNKKIAAIHDALVVYYSATQTLPPPASLVATPTSSSSTKGNYLTYNASCTDSWPIPTTGTVTGCITVATSVMIGAVPTRTLGLPDSYAFDDWGNRFTYAVDTALSNTITLNNTASAPIDVYDLSTPPQLNPSGQGKVSAVVVSHGKDGQGSYTKAGLANIATCVTSPESENCDGSNATFMMDNSTTGYDDYTTYIAILACTVAKPCPIAFDLQDTTSHSGDEYQIFRYSNTGGFNNTAVDKQDWSNDASTLNPNSFIQNGSIWTAPAANAFIDGVSCVLMTSTGYTLCGFGGDSSRYGAILINPTSGIVAKGGGVLTGGATRTVGNAVACAAISDHEALCVVNTDYTNAVMRPFYVSTTSNSVTITPGTTSINAINSTNASVMSCAKSNGSSMLCLAGSASNSYVSAFSVVYNGGVLSLVNSSYYSIPTNQTAYQGFACAPSTYVPSGLITNGLDRTAVACLLTSSPKTTSDTSIAYGIKIIPNSDYTGAPSLMLINGVGIATSLTSPGTSGVANTGYIAVPDSYTAKSGSNIQWPERPSCALINAAGNVDKYSCLIAYDKSANMYEIKMYVDFPTATQANSYLQDPGMAAGVCPKLTYVGGGGGTTVNLTCSDSSGTRFCMRNGVNGYTYQTFNFTPSITMGTPGTCSSYNPGTGSATTFFTPTRAGIDLSVSKIQ